MSGSIDAGSRLASIQSKRQAMFARFQSEHQELIRDLKRTPHLRLPINITPAELDRLRVEVNQVEDYISHQVEAERSIEYRQAYGRSWKMRNLIHLNRDSRDMRNTGSISKSEIEYDARGIMQFFTTDLGERMPQAIELVNRISRFRGRTRIARLSAGGSIPWHTHCQFKYYQPVPLRIGIVHIPVYTNPQVNYEVSYVGQGDEREQVWRQQYRPGEVWLINSWHDHRVVNAGLTNRISIFAYCPLTDPAFRALVERAMFLRKENSAPGDWMQES